MDDTFFVNSTEEVRAGSGDDIVMIRDDTATSLYGESGDDELYGNLASNILDGGSGSDLIVGAAGDDVISGGLGADTISAGTGDDVIAGDGGADIITAGAGKDKITGGTGADTISGDAGDDVISGDDGADIISGGSGDDVLTGGAANDILDGGAGDDIAIYAGNMADYKIDVGREGLTHITDLNSEDGDEGVDSLSNVETVRFADGELTVTKDADGEVRVNTYTSYQQNTPSVTNLADGNYVVIWADSSGHDGGSGWDVWGQIYSEDGLSVGDDFRVNSYVSSSQYHPDVTALSNGGFAVTWSDSSGHDGGSGWDIRTQRFDASGSAIGEEILVNSYISGSQYVPSVGALSDGGFVVTWEDHSSGSHGGTLHDVYGQRFDSNGVSVGDEFRVNETQVSGYQYTPEVVGLANGGFAISWRDDDGSSHNDGTGVGSGYDVWMRVFDAQGSEVAGEFRVNEAHVSGSQYEPALASLSNGNFIVTWRDSDGSSHDDGTGTGSSNDVWARIFSNDGTEVVGEFRINSYTSSSQYEPDVTALKGGNFIVTWRDDSGHGGGSGSDIRAQVHSNDGTVILPEFMVNTYTMGSQYQPAVAALDDGGFVISWTSQYQDGSNTGVYSQRFDASGTALSTIRLTGGSGDDIVTFVDAQEEILVDLGAGNDTLNLGDKADSIRVQSVENVSLGGGDDRAIIEGSDNVTIDAGAGNDQITSGDGSDTLIGGLGNDIYTVNDSGDTIVENAGEGNDTIVSTADNYTLSDNVEDLRLGIGGVAATGNDADNILAGNDGDNSLAGGAGNDSIVAGAGDDVLTGGIGNDTLSGGAGNDVATFSGKMSDYRIDAVNQTVTDLNTADGDDGTDTYSGIEKLRFGDGGELSVSEVDDNRINTYTSSDQSLPSVTGLKDGNYVVTWADSSGHDGGSSWDIRGQIMSRDGAPLGSEFRINDYVSSNQQDPSVAALEDGGFIVTWYDE